MPSTPELEVHVGTASATDNAIQVMGSMYNTNKYYRGENSLPWVREALFNRWEQEGGGGFSHRLCIEGTRTKILETLDEWAMDDEPDSKCIFWLSGMAGTGKSTIARTFCYRSNTGRQGLKLVSFFFCGTPETTSTATKLITTLAYQLLVDWGDHPMGRLMKSEINKAIDANPMLPNQNAERQWRALIIEPLRRCEKQLREAAEESRIPRHPPIIFVIDALDECREEAGLREVLLLLPELAQFRRPRIRVLVTSRPDPPGLQGTLRAEEIMKTTRNFSLHDDVNREDVRSDIETFIRHQLRDMSLRSPRIGVASPSEEDVRELLDKSGDLFLYAVTATQFMQDSRFETPGERLRALLRPPTTDTQTEALGSLYGIYNQILRSAVGFNGDKVSKEDIDGNICRLKDVLGPIILLIDPLPVHIVFNLMKLDCQARNRAELVLQYTQSVLHAPLDSQEPVRILHNSFRDFLLEANINSQFHIDERQTHHRLFRDCLSIMDRHLVRDAQSIVDRWPDHSPRRMTADDNLPPEVHYACRYWMQHMARAGVEMPSEELEDFSAHGVVQWVDACTRLGYLAEISSCVQLFKAPMLRNPRNPQNARILQAIFKIGSLSAIQETSTHGLTREAGTKENARAAAGDSSGNTGAIAAGSFAAGFVCLCLLYVGSRGPLNR